MRTLLGIGSLALLTVTFAAQSPETQSPETQSAETQSPETGNMALLASPSSNGCPVGFEAKHTPGGEVVRVSPSEKPHGTGYSLTFAPNGSRGIVLAKVTLHGLAGHQVVPAGNQSGTDATEDFTVKPSAETKHRFGTVVYAEKLTGVRWVELNELTYADGTAWHASQTSTCRVAPNGYMLVSATN